MSGTSVVQSRPDEWAVYLDDGSLAGVVIRSGRWYRWSTPDFDTGRSRSLSAAVSRVVVASYRQLSFPFFGEVS